MSGWAAAARRAAPAAVAVALVSGAAPAAAQSGSVALGAVPVPTAGDITVARLAFDGPTQRPRVRATATGLGSRDQVVGRALRLADRRWAAWVVVKRAQVGDARAAQRGLVRVRVLPRESDRRSRLIRRIRRSFVDVVQKPKPEGTSSVFRSELERLGALMEARDRLIALQRREPTRVVVREAMEALFDELPTGPSASEPPSPPPPGGAEPSFGITADSSHRHTGPGSSEVCFAVQSAPARPFATLRVRTSGPGVEAGGDQTVSLDANGFRLVRVQITAYGSYTASIDATAADGGTATTTKQHTVAEADGGCPPP